MTLALTNLATLLQTLSPVVMRGRITALWFLCWLGARPVGATVNGSAADRLGVTWVLAVAGLAVLGAAVGCALVWARAPAPTGPICPRDNA